MNLLHLLKADRPRRRVELSGSRLGGSVDHYEQRTLLSATVFTVEQQKTAQPADLAANFDGTWNVTANNNGTGTILIDQNGRDTQATVNVGTYQFTGTGNVFLKWLRVKNVTEVDGVKVKQILRAHKTGDDEMAGVLKIKAKGSPKVVDNFQGDRVIDG